jgi:quinol monooxygenase YgiN
MPTLREPGVLEYRTWATAHDPCGVHSVAIFTSAQAHLDHIGSDHIRVLLNAISDIKFEVALTAYRGELASPT